MQLIPHISQYLKLHKKVALVGLGIFYLKRINGFLDEDSQTLYPPSIKVKFDEKEILDSDFAQYVSNQSQIELEKIIYHLEKLVRDIKKEVESGSAYILENIGSLELNRGNIKLIKPDNTIYNQAFFGLKPQTYTSNKDEHFIQPTIEKELELSGKVEQPQQDFSASHTLTEEGLNSSSLTESEIPPSRKFTWLWVSIIVLIAVAILCAIGYYFYPFNLAQLKKAPVKKVVPIVYKVELPQKPDSVIHHEVIIAENLSAINADKLIAKLKIKGIDAHIIVDSLKSYVKISAAQFTDLDSAEAKLKNIQKQYYPNAYLQSTKSIK